MQKLPNFDDLKEVSQKYREIKKDLIPVGELKQFYYRCYSIDFIEDSLEWMIEDGEFIIGFSTEDSDDHSTEYHEFRIKVSEIEEKMDTSKTLPEFLCKYFTWQEENHKKVRNLQKSIHDEEKPLEKLNEKIETIKSQIQSLSEDKRFTQEYKDTEIAKKNTTKKGLEDKKIRLEKEIESKTQSYREELKKLTEEKFCDI